MTTNTENVKFKVINDTRKFEIALFWQRAIFFGGFISIIFVGYYNIKEFNLLKFILSVFGVLCSFFWILANKGSKFWQENWEGQIDHSNVMEKTTMFGTLYRREIRGILGAKRFSPSKLAIALSIYITFLWMIIVVHSFINLSTPMLKLLGLNFLVLTLIFIEITVFLVSTPKDKWRRSTKGGWEIRENPNDINIGQSNQE